MASKNKIAASDPSLKRMEFFWKTFETVIQTNEMASKFPGKDDGRFQEKTMTDFYSPPGTKARK